VKAIDEFKSKAVQISKYDYYNTGAKQVYLVKIL